MEKDAFGNEHKANEVDKILADASNYSDDIITKLEDAYEDFNQDERLKDTVIMLNSLPDMSGFSRKETLLFNLFSNGDIVDIFEFFNVDVETANANGFEEYLYTLLGESAILNLKFEWNDATVKEILTLLDVNQEAFRAGTTGDYNLLIKSIKGITKSKQFIEVENSKKTLYFVITANSYVDFYKKKHNITNTFDLFKRYWHIQGWRLFKQVSRASYIRKRDSTIDFQRYWKIRNYHYRTLDFYESNYYDYLLEDLDKYEKWIRETSIKNNISKRTKAYIVNYYKISLWAMIKSKGYESGQLAIKIINGEISFNNSNEAYIREGIGSLKEDLLSKKKFPSPEKIARDIGLTVARAESYNIKLLRIDAEPINRINKWKRTKGQLSRKQYRNSINPMKNEEKKKKVDAVAKLTKEGNTIEVIAEQLNLSEKTVSNYRRIIKENKSNK